MTLNRIRPAIIAVFLVSALTAYGFFLALKSKVTGQKLSQASQCGYGEGATLSSIKNPNKAFFVSCGGFIE